MCLIKPLSDHVLIHQVLQHSSVLRLSSNSTNLLTAAQESVTTSMWLHEHNSVKLPHFGEEKQQHVRGTGK